MVPGPVVGWGLLSVGLLGKLVNLGQRGSQTVSSAMEEAKLYKLYAL